MVTDLSTAKISKSTTPVMLQPNHRSEASSELLFGESIQVLEQDGKWCKISSKHDNYEGFVKTAACDFSAPATTHWVSTQATYAFEKPDIKSTICQRVLFGSKLALAEISGNSKFFKLNNGGYIWAAHVLKKNTALTMSMIEIAQNNYLYAPYRWGGRSTDGCDCSGLVQMIAMAQGVNLPRDTVDQEPALPDVEYDNRMAEDLVYWPGHVGILQTPDLLLHSTAHSMRCCIEPLRDVVQRAGKPSSIKRIQNND